MQAQRKATQPTNKRTFGSVFKNPAHELGAGRMLEECGLKGHRIGDALISPRHANFIENAGDATALDALALMAEARRRALDRFGVVLEREVELLGDLELPSERRRDPLGGAQARRTAGACGEPSLPMPASDPRNRLRSGRGGVCCRSWRRWCSSRLRSAPTWRRGRRGSSRWSGSRSWARRPPLLPRSRRRCVRTWDAAWSGSTRARPRGGSPPSPRSRTRASTGRSRTR